MSDENKFKDFINENTNFSPEKPSGEWREIVNKIDKKPLFPSLRIFSVFAGGVALALILFFSVFQTQNLNRESSSTDQQLLAEFLFEDEILEDENNFEDEF